MMGLDKKQYHPQCKTLAHETYKLKQALQELKTELEALKNVLIYLINIRFNCMRVNYDVQCYL